MYMCVYQVSVLPKSARTKRKVGKSTKNLTNIRTHILGSTYSVTRKTPQPSGPSLATSSSETTAIKRGTSSGNGGVAEMAAVGKI